MTLTPARISAPDATLSFKVPTGEGLNSATLDRLLVLVELIGSWAVAAVLAPMSPLMVKVVPATQSTFRHPRVTVRVFVADAIGVLCAIENCENAGTIVNKGSAPRGTPRRDDPVLLISADGPLAELLLYKHLTVAMTLTEGDGC